jgi:LacI family transcriptional regulator
VNNNLAVAVLETLHKIGKKIPDDISLVSYDDIRLFRFCVPTITAVAQPVEQIGERAVELLLSEIEKDGKKDNNNKIVLPPSFVIRNSSSKI